MIRNGLWNMKRQYFKKLLISPGEKKVCSLEPYREAEKQISMNKKYLFNVIVQELYFHICTLSDK